MGTNFFSHVSGKSSKRVGFNRTYSVLVWIQFGREVIGCGWMRKNQPRIGANLARQSLARLRSSACSQTFGLLSDSGLRPSLRVQPAPALRALRIILNFLKLYTDTRDKINRESARIRPSGEHNRICFSSLSQSSYAVLLVPSSGTFGQILSPPQRLILFIGINSLFSNR